MTRNKILYLVLNIIIINLLIIGLVNQDLLFDNYSIYAHGLKNHSYLLSTALLISISNAILTNILNKKYVLLSFISFLIAAIFPYSTNEYSILNDVHIILAYLGFALSILTFLINNFYFKTYNMKLGNIILYLFFFVLIIVIYIYLKYQVVNFLSEVIYTNAYVILNLLMYFYVDID